MSAEIGKQGFLSLKHGWVGPEEQADIENVYGPNPNGSTAQTNNLEKSSLNIFNLTAEVFGKRTERLHLAFGALGRLTLKRSQPKLANQT